jgi:putative redox protein
VPEARAVATIAAPADPSHVTGLLKDHVDEIRARGEVEVTLAGRPFRIRREFLDDVSGQRLDEKIATLRKALLVLHAPTDDIVGIDNASHIFLAAKHPKSFVSLADADHLLSKPRDAAYVADVIAAWAGRYLDMEAATEAAATEPRSVVVTETGAGKFQQIVQVGRHSLIADEPVQAGGLNSGPGPYDLLLAALGACTSMTLRLYADRKQFPLERTSVKLTHSRIHAADCETCETKEGMLDRIDKEITVEGPLDTDARARLLEIAEKCPVNRTLKSEIDIRGTIRTAE